MDIRESAGPVLDVFSASRLGEVDRLTQLLDRDPALARAELTDGTTALHLAARSGQGEAVVLLLGKDADPNHRDADGRTPLHSMAPACTMIDVMELLLCNGADGNASDAHGNSMLFLTAECIHESFDWGYHYGATQFLLQKGVDVDVGTAVILNDTEKLEALLDGDRALAGSRERGGYLPDGSTPAHHAADRCHVEALQILLAHGADITATDTHGRPPLYLAAHEAGTRKGKPCGPVVDLLLEHGAPVDVFACALLGHLQQMTDILGAGSATIHSQDEGGNTPLHLAAWNGKLETVEALLGSGTDVNARNGRGETPVEMATTYSHREVVELLLRHGAECDIFTAVALGKVDQVKRRLREDPAKANVRNRYGETPLSWTIWTGVRGIEASGPEISRLLLEQGASLDLATAIDLGLDEEALRIVDSDPTLVNQGTDPPLHRAARAGRLDLIEPLVERGAALEARGPIQKTPLAVAARYGRLEAIKALKALGACLNTRDNYGDTPLVRAADFGNSEVVEVLLACGADTDAPDYLGGTPLHWAAWEGHPSVARALLDHGASVEARGWGWWNEGKTPAELALEKGHDDVAAIFDRHEQQAPKP